VRDRHPSAKNGAPGDSDEALNPKTQKLCALRALYTPFESAFIRVYPRRTHVYVCLVSRTISSLLMLTASRGLGMTTGLSVWVLALERKECVRLPANLTAGKCLDKEEPEMALRPGDICPTTGQYKCSGTASEPCGHLLVVNKPEKMPPCPKCKQAGTSGTLVRAL